LGKRDSNNMKKRRLECIRVGSRKWQRVQFNLIAACERANQAAAESWGITQPAKHFTSWASRSVIYASAMNIEHVPSMKNQSEE
jgi:hypothetical protein